MTQPDDLPAAPPSLPRVQVVLAVYDPEPGYLAEQLRSLAAQTGVEMVLHAVIADLDSSVVVQRLARAAGLAVRVHLPLRKLTAVAAFEHGLTEALAASEPDDLFAFCDQDDIWDPDKLAVSAAALRARSGCHLVHTDARLIDAGGTALAPSLFRAERRAPGMGLRRLLYRNAVTGMTAVFTRELVAHALPFPAQGGAFFYHDLWLAMVAAAKGPIEVLPRATVSYRQHGGNAVGRVVRGGGPRRLSRTWLRQRFGSYALACYLAKSLILRVEQVSVSEPDCFDQQRLRALRPYLRHRGMGGAFLGDALGFGLRGYGELADHAFSQGVVKAGRLVWAARRMVLRDLDNRLREFDDLGYSMAPGLAPRSEPRVLTDGRKAVVPARARDWTSHVDPRCRPGWTPQIVDRPAACVVLVPTLNPTEIFAGVATALSLGVELARRGVPVRFVATDLPMVSPHASRSFISDLVPLAERSAVLERIDLVCGVSATELEVAPDDTFLATAWWTAHLAQDLMQLPGLRKQRFLYLVQDYEPNFYAWGTEYAAARDSYALDCTPVFNTTLLRDYFHAQGHRFDGQAGLCFRPSIDIGRYAGLARVPGRRHRRIAVYGRPEVPRNMFPMCVEALARFIETEAPDPDGLEIVSVGMAHEPVVLPNGLVMQSLGKLAMEDYPVFLATVDLGLSLMYSPHPSHVPLEMAAAGARVVTNTFGPKDLSQLTPLIYSCDASARDAARVLGHAWAAIPEAIAPAARHFDLAGIGVPIDDIASELACELLQRDGVRRVA